MLSKEMCEKIWHCHREIETGEKLLVDIREAFEKNKHEPHAQALKDAFGRCQNMQLGVPSSENAHRIFQVSYDLAEPIIRTHIANKRAELAKLNEVARLEITGA